MEPLGLGGAGGEAYSACGGGGGGGGYYGGGGGAAYYTTNRGDASGAGGAVEAARPTPSGRPQTCAFGKGGKTRNATGWLS